MEALSADLNFEIGNLEWKRNSKCAPPFPSSGQAGVSVPGSAVDGSDKGEARINLAAIKGGPTESKSEAGQMLPHRKNQTQILRCVQDDKPGKVRVREV
jgi:hypothetical protein